MATVTTQRGSQSILPTQRRFSCCRCHEPIVRGVIAGSWETWVTAAEGDPWCQGGAHLPRPDAC